MLQKEEAGIVYFQFESFGAYDRIQHAIFSRQGGISQPPHDSLNLSVSVPDEKTAVYTNRSKAFGLFERQNDTVVHAYLVHGSGVAQVTQANNGTWVEHVDALITNEPGCGLTMNFADCTPIFLVDPVRHAIGLGHAGWKGTVVDLPGAMVRAMQQQFGSNPADLLAGIGPCISWANYEVDEPLVSEVQATFSEWDTLLKRPSLNGNGRYHFDLPEANRQRLIQAGVRHIECSGLCTADRTDLFFSHRAERGKTGRFGSIFVLLPGPR